MGFDEFGSVADIVIVEELAAIEYRLTAYHRDPLPAIPSFQPMLDLWDGRRGGMVMPAWDAFDFSDFVGWHGKISVSERDGDDFRLRLFGTEWSGLFSRDLTGDCIIESLDPGVAPYVKRHFATLMQGPCIGHAKGYVPLPDRKFIPFNVIDLPMGPPDGPVTHFLHGLKVLSMDETD